MIQHYSTDTHWEKETAYSRAVKVGQQIFVSGTTAVDENGAIQFPNDLEQQCFFIFGKIEKALTALGATLNDVVRTKAYVTNINNYQGFSKAHQHFFKEVKPACTLVEINALIDKDLVVEIEVDAIITD